MTPLKVNLQQKHIDRGQRRNCAKCPVALAILDVNGVSSVATSETSGSVIINGEYKCFFIPENITRKIQAFDEFGVMEPDEFEITLV